MPGGIKLGEDHRSRWGVEAEDGELVDGAEGFGPEDFIRSAGGGDGAVVQKNELVGEGGAEIDVVGGEDHGQLLLLRELAEKFKQIDLVVEVEVGVGFIEQEHARFLDETAGEEDALTLAAGEVVDGAMEEVGEVEEFGSFLDDIHVVLGFEAEDLPVGSAAKAQVIADGVGGVVGWGLGEIGDAAGECFAGPVVESAALPEDGAGGAEVAEEDFDEGGFSGAVGAEDGEDLAAFEGEGDVAEGGFVCEIGEGEVFGLEDGFRHRGALLEELTTKTRRHEGQLVGEREIGRGRFSF